MVCFPWEGKSQSLNSVFYSIWLHGEFIGFHFVLSVVSKMKKKHSSYETSIENFYHGLLLLIGMKNITPTLTSWAENKVCIMWMNGFWFSMLQYLPLLHISNLLIGFHTGHNTDVISGSWLSQYGSHVACMIISNPLCSGSGLAADPCWPLWNWFLRLNPKQPQIKPRFSGKRETGKNWGTESERAAENKRNRGERNILGLLKGVF